MALPDTARSRRFAHGDGAMGRMIDDFDWSATALGPVEDWPAVVCDAVGLVLRSPVPMVTLWGQDGVMIYNDAYSAVAGWRHPGLLGAPVHQGWSEIVAFNDHMMKVVLAGGTLSYRDQELTLDSRGQPSRRWFNLDYSPIVDEAGRVAGVIAIVVETTARVRAERHLAAERTRLHAMFGQAPGFMAMLEGPAHRYEMVNEAFVSLAQRNDLVGRTVAEAMPEVAAQGFLALLDEVFGSGRPYRGDATEMRLAGADGDIRLHYLDFVYQPVRDDSGAVAGIFVQGTDVTARVLAERALAASEMRFRGFAQAMPHQVWAANASGRLDWLNERIFTYSGFRAEELDGEGWGRLVHPGDLHLVRSRWSESLATGAPYEAEVRLRRADGSYRWHLNRAVPLRDADGRVTGWIGTNTDIEEQKNTAQHHAMLNGDLQGQVALRTAERDRMWRLSKDIMLVCGFDGRVEAVNPAFGALLGWSDTDILGKNFLEFVHPEDRSAAIGRMAALARGEDVVKFENRFRRREGGWCLLSWSAAPDARFVHAVGRDITAEREEAGAILRAGLALQEALKMEAVGRLAGKAAHAFDALLRTIAEQLDGIPPASGGAAGIEEARAAADEGARLAGMLLSFGRRQLLVPEVVPAGRLVAGAQDALRRGLGDDIVFKVVVADGLWNTAVDVARLREALLHLANNAREASAGSVTLEAANALLDDQYCRARGDVLPGEYVLLSVGDTGHGMSPEICRRAVEPFFSTREDTVGAGLGLSMAYGFARQSGGHLAIDSEPGQGTLVRVYLPRSMAEEGSLPRV